MFKGTLKAFFLIAIVVFSFFFFLQDVASSEVDEKEEITVYFFEDRMCPVCRDQKKFMEEIKEDYPQMRLEIYPISDFEKLEEIARKHGVEDPEIMAPTTFIGENYFQFSYFTENHKQKIIDALEGKIVEQDCCIVNIPLLNLEVDIRDWSLPLTTAVLGSLDGFNVCSIGALILILSIVLAFKSRKKIFFFGGLFIVTAVTIYGVLVFMWGQLFRALVGHLGILSVIVGLAALGGGVYFFKEFWRFHKHGPTCESSNSEIAKKATKKLQETFTDTKKGVLAMAGSVMLFAVIITVIELPCSVGIPIAFTGILTQAELPLSSFVFYIALYLFFYMLIEIIIFAGAVFTKEIWFANSKAITWVTLVGSLVLFYLGFYYLLGGF